MADKKKDYEVLYRIRLGDGTLVRPASEENPGGASDEVKTIELTEEEAAPFLATGAIRPVPTRRRTAATGQEETPPAVPLAPVSPAPPAPPSGEGPTLAEAFGDDLASTLQEAGYSSVDQVRAASDEELLEIKGFGEKSLEKVRAS